MAFGPRGKDRISRVLSRSAREAKNYRRWMRFLPILLSVMITTTAAGYAVAALYDKYGSYTVSVNKLDSLRYSLALSEDRHFNTTTSRLNAKAAENITNIEGDKDLPKDLDLIDGQHNGDNYLAYTYYLKNVGEATVTYEYLLYIVNVQNELDKAVRVRLYVDGVATDYARTATDGSGPEPGTEAFTSLTTIARKQVANFAKNEITRFTVVIWIEGPDPDCTDAVIGGEFKIDMSISIVAVDNDGDGTVDETFAAQPEATEALETPAQDALPANKPEDET